MPSSASCNVPIDVFETLREKAEDYDDQIAYDDAKHNAGEWIPAETAGRIIAGENKIKVWREYRGLTQTQLAQQADIAQATIAQLETGTRDGSIAVLKRIAGVLMVDLDDLV